MGQDFSNRQPSGNFCMCLYMMFLSFFHINRFFNFTCLSLLEEGTRKVARTPRDLLSVKCFLSNRGCVKNHIFWVFSFKYFSNNISERLDLLYKLSATFFLGIFFLQKSFLKSMFLSG